MSLHTVRGDDIGCVVNLDKVTDINTRRTQQLESYVFVNYSYRFHIICSERTREGTRNKEAIFKIATNFSVELSRLKDALNKHRKDKTLKKLGEILSLVGTIESGLGVDNPLENEEKIKESYESDKNYASAKKICERLERIETFLREKNERDEI